ncbi:Uncharacterised protein [Legionella israelensis]|uniref:DNA topoisomerase III n=1 Tax=Legionella israelensis TaxID=454 RepID=A0A0W0WAH4_9GAMM|nr:DNA topoisomerase III [Legionella israelensis]SCY46945.1 hypothetical protein SAMN02746069_02565 [Legionella israelensis DSM 19235]STX61074.1 Uncharacterised protein [Legionella israelensis]
MRLFICEKPSQARDIANVMDESFEKEDGRVGFLFLETTIPHLIFLPILIKTHHLNRKITRYMLTKEII